MTDSLARLRDGSEEVVSQKAELAAWIAVMVNHLHAFVDRREILLQLIVLLCCERDNVRQGSDFGLKLVLQVWHRSCC